MREMDGRPDGPFSIETTTGMDYENGGREMDGPFHFGKK